MRKNTESTKEMNTKIVLGRGLKSIREGRNQSPYYFTKHHGIRQEQVAAIEQGTANYTIDTLLAYVDALGLQLAVYDDLPI